MVRVDEQFIDTILIPEFNALNSELTNYFNEALEKIIKEEFSC